MRQINRTGHPSSTVFSLAYNKSAQFHYRRNKPIATPYHADTVLLTPTEN